MNVKAVALLVSALAAIWFAPQVTPTRGLQTVELNTRAFGCDGARHELIAPLTRNARVRKIVVWLGAYDYTNADIIYSIEHIDAAGQYQSVAKAGWDHYARGENGLGSQMFAYDFAPDWIAIGAGESLALEAQCNPMDEATKTKKAHVIALIYYLE